MLLEGPRICTTDLKISNAINHNAVSFELCHMNLQALNEQSFSLASKILGATALARLVAVSQRNEKGNEIAVAG